MKVKCIDTISPRSDGVEGPPGNLTEGRLYEVAEVLDTQFSIINNEMKMGRYSKYRFEVVDHNHVLPLRNNFNRLTTPLRSKIKELERKIAEMEG